MKPLNKPGLVVAGVTLVCAGVVGFAASATTSGGVTPVADAKNASSQSASSSSSDSDDDDSGWPELLHSETVVKDSENGKITYWDAQGGKLTARSGSSLTVKSSDGTEWVWKVTDDTDIWTDDKDGRKDDSASSLKVGDTVTVHGTRNGDTRTAEHVSDPAFPDWKNLDKRLDDLRDNLRKHWDLDLPEGLDDLPKHMGNPWHDGRMLSLKDLIER